MTQKIGKIDPELKARLDYIAKQRDYFIYKDNSPGNMSWALTMIQWYQLVLDGME